MILSTRNDTYRQGIIKWVAVLFALITAFLVFAPSAFAEGTRDLVANGGYRPYTERYNSSTLGQQRLSVMHVYLEKGETAYFGTSVTDAKLYEVSDNKNSGWLFSNSAMGTSYSDAQLAYVNTADIYIAQGEYSTIADAIAAGKTPGKDGVTLIDLTDDATSVTPGYIYNSAQEAGGVDRTGSGAGYKVAIENTISDSTSGYVAGAKTNANAFNAPSTGIYTVVFFSQKHNGDNPIKCKTSDLTAFKTLQKGGTIASWDISVYNNGVRQTGRVFTSTLFINMGGNVLSGGVSQGSLYSDIYAVTDDGYQYKVDFNGMDPFGFVFFANNRGLLNTENSTTTSLYHGLRSNNNTLSDVANHYVALNNTPYTILDKTYNLFYENPSSAALKALGISDPSTSGSISDFKFIGNDDSTDNQGYVGKGGTFSFSVGSVSATSYEIDLNFGEGNTVVLSNALRSGTNTIPWDGKDAQGNVVPAGTYDTSKITVKLKGGEVHFPLLDVEQNPNGIKITRLNGEGTSADKSQVFFNNSAANAGDVGKDWTLEKNWEVGNQTDATSGVDSTNGAMAFTNANTKGGAKGMTLLGDGDQSALDLWAYYSTTATPTGASFTLVDASFTVTKVWSNELGTPVAGNPKDVTMTLQSSTDKGATWTDVSTDDTGAAITNPVTYDTSVSAAYTWTGLNPALTYQVVEKSITGYRTVYGEVGKTVSTDTGQTIFSQEVDNAYAPTTLMLTKVWNMNGSAETHPASVTLSVYTSSTKSAETHIGDYPLNADNDWTKTIDVDSTLTYFVYETAVDGSALPGDFAYTITGEGKASGNATDGYTATITDSFNSGDYMSVEVFKYWTDGDTYRDYQPDSILVTLYKDGTKVTTDATGQAIANPVTLDDANSWYYVWPALVASNTGDEGYTITETDANGNELKGYTAKEDSLNFLHNFGYGGFENTYQTTSFTASKTWVNGVNATQPDSATVQLEQSTDGGTTYTDYGAAVTLDEDGEWTYTWSDLPAYTKSGAQILYKAAETAISGYTTTDSGVSGTVAAGFQQAFTNTYAYTNIKVSKVWDHGTQGESEQPQSVNIALKDSNGVVTSCVLDADNDWTYTFANIPIPTDGTSTDDVYTVSEESVDGYDADYNPLEGSDADGWTTTVDNTYNLTKLTVAKTWNHGVQAEAEWPTSAIVTLYANGTVKDTATLSSGNSWTHTFDSLPINDSNGKAIAYTVSEDAVPSYITAIGDKTGSDATGWSVAITNTFDPTTLTATKVWNHGTQAEKDWPTSVTLQLYADGTAYGDPVTLTAADADKTTGNWVHTWTGLDKTKTYLVSELTVEGYTTTGGTVEGSAANGYKATFTNTYVEPSPSPSASTSTSTVTTGDTTGTASTVNSMPDTGDRTRVLIIVLAAVLIAGVAIIVIALVRRRNGGGKGGKSKGAHSR